jgi:hypothetical protein
MDDNSSMALGMAITALILVLMEAKRLTRMQQDIDLIADGDTETVKLRRKLDGYRGQSDG